MRKDLIRSITYKMLRNLVLLEKTCLSSKEGMQIRACPNPGFLAHKTAADSCCVLILLIKKHLNSLYRANPSY